MKRFALWIPLLFLYYESEAFILWKNHRRFQEVDSRCSSATSLNLAIHGQIDFVSDIQKKIVKYLDNASDIRIHSFSLANHKPLGCSAEECLKVEEDGMKHVFVSSLVVGGNADKAGILVGDVLVGVSGSFSDIEDVFGLGLGRVYVLCFHKSCLILLLFELPPCIHFLSIDSRSLVAGRPTNQNLELYVLRGTDIQSKHDSALIDLCILPEDSDVIMGDCIKALYDASYDTLDDIVGSPGACNDKDTECMLDAMFRYWDDQED